MGLKSVADALRAPAFGGRKQIGLALKAFLKKKYLGSSICAGGGHLLSLTQEADKVPPPAAPGLPLRPPAPGLWAGGRKEGETLYTQLHLSSQGADPPADPTRDGGRPLPPAGPQSTDLAADTAACILDSTAAQHPPCLLCLFSEAQCPGHPRPPRVCEEDPEHRGAAAPIPGSPRLLAGAGVGVRQAFPISRLLV